MESNFCDSDGSRRANSGHVERCRYPMEKGVLVSPNALSLQVHDIVESNFQDSDGVVLKIQVMRRVASLTRQNSFFVDKYLICQWFCTFNC